MWVCIIRDKTVPTWPHCWTQPRRQSFPNGPYLWRRCPPSRCQMETGVGIWRRTSSMSFSEDTNQLNKEPWKRNMVTWQKSDNILWAQRSCGSYIGGPSLLAHLSSESSVGGPGLLGPLADIVVRSPIIISGFFLQMQTAVATPAL